MPGYDVRTVRGSGGEWGRGSTGRNVDVHSNFFFKFTKTHYTFFFKKLSERVRAKSFLNYRAFKG